MVEINNQRKAFLDMLAWSEGTDNGRQKTRNVVMTSLWQTVTDYSDHPRKAVTLNWKLKSTERRTLPASFQLVGCLPQAAWPERLLSESRTLWHCSRLRSVALYLWLIVVISVRQSTVTPISDYCRALVMVSSSIRLTAWLQNSKRAERSEIDVWRKSPRLSRSGYLHHRLPVMGC